MHYFISAGEASGDLHAARLIERLKHYDPEARFTFLGGDLMEAEASHEPLIHYRDMAYMGFVEVLRHLHKVTGNLNTAAKALMQSRPDALILVDYPSFNLRLARKAKNAGIPVFYYISPKVWAWKEGRVKKIRRYVDRMLSILPFEPEYYLSRHHYEATYVGNPSVMEIDERLSKLAPRDEFCKMNGLDPDKPILALLPGSRVSEIKSNLPIMDEVARRHPDYQAVIAGAPAIDAALYSQLSSLPVKFGATFDLTAYADAALVTSGTATLEAALCGTPQIVCYRNNGSRLTYWLFSHILKIPFVSLPNLIAQRKVVDELLLHLCTPDNVDRALAPLLSDTPERRAMIEGYAEIRRNLTDADAADTAAAIICADLGQKACK